MSLIVNNDQLIKINIIVYIWLVFYAIGLVCYENPIQSPRIVSIQIEINITCAITRKSIGIYADSVYLDMFGKILEFWYKFTNKAEVQTLKNAVWVDRSRRLAMWQRETWGHVWNLLEFEKHTDMEA